MKLRMPGLPVLALGIAILGSLPAAAPALTAEPAAKPAADKTATGKMAMDKADAAATTVEGELIDEACYAKMKAHGPDHVDCATKCAKNGSPVGVLDAKGNVFTLMAPAPSFADHMGATVRVTGKIDMTSHLVIPDKVEVQSGTTWTTIELPKSS